MATENAIAEKEVAIAKAEEEEKKLAQEIKETQEEQLISTPSSSISSSSSSMMMTSVAAAGGVSTTNNPAAAAYNKLEKRLKLEAGICLSWGDEIDLEEQLNNETRYPGRAIQLHEKLSSPARKKEPQEAFNEHQEKQKQVLIQKINLKHF